MPIYEYACQDCGQPFEALVRSGDTPACPRCHSVALAKQLSVFATAGAAGDAGRARAEALAAARAAAPCGSCGHPDGPGACRLD